MNLEQKFPKLVLRITYEDLLIETEKTIKQICCFLGIDYNREIFEFPKNSIKKYGEFYTNIHSNITRGIDQKRIAAWEARLTNQEIETVEYICARLMHQLGYPKKIILPNLPKHRVGFYYIDRLIKLHYQFIHYIKKRKGYLKCVYNRRRKLGLLHKMFDEKF